MSFIIEEAKKNFYYKELREKLLFNKEDYSTFLAGLSLLKNLITPLAKNVLVPLGLTATASATDCRDMDHIKKIVKSLEESGLLRKGVSEIIGNEAKEKKMDFLACY